MPSGDTGMKSGETAFNCLFKLFSQLLVTIATLIAAKLLPWFH